MTCLWKYIWGEELTLAQIQALEETILAEAVPVYIICYTDWSLLRHGVSIFFDKQTLIPFWKPFFWLAEHPQELVVSV